MNIKISKVNLSAAKVITHRDQIHGDVRYDPLAVALLNTATLQRLGRIYQLGYAHLVFRGGTHTRLSHVMGAAHVAGKLVDLVRQNYLETEDFPRGAVDPETFLPKGPKGVTTEQRWDVLRHLVRWAALLHDIGHVPLGHTLEDEFDKIYTKHDAFESPRIPYLWHEISVGQNSEVRDVFQRKELLPPSFSALDIGWEQAWQCVMLICLHKEKVNADARISFRELLEAVDANELPFVRVLLDALNMTEEKLFFPYMADIVANTICADYLDYLRRDATNVGLDVLRDDRVASRFFVGRDSKKALRMALALTDRRGKARLDTCTGVVELVRQRFRFAEIIYYHKTKVAASAMLAKVFALVERPNEIGSGCATIEIEDVAQLTEGIMSGEEDLETLRREHLPSALLDPDIGDETLLLWLQYRAWDILENAREADDAKQVRRCLRGIALLQAIVRRRLYKVCLTINRESYAALSPGSKENYEVEDRIQRTLEKYRKNVDARTALEAKMAQEAGWEDDSLLLYIPPRKSQAKGIETGALDEGDVVTLGKHSAVKQEVDRLNESYQKLWRIILLVHPNHARDAVGLSRAADVLVRELWPAIEPQSLVKPLCDAAWFHYIAECERLAAAQYADLITPEKPDWKLFEQAARLTTNGTVASEEHAQRAVLLTMINTNDAARLIKEQFVTAGSLSRRIEDLEPQLVVEGRDADSREVRLRAIWHIARELAPANSRERPRKGSRLRNQGTSFFESFFE